MRWKAELGVLVMLCGLGAGTSMAQTVLQPSTTPPPKPTTSDTRLVDAQKAVDQNDYARAAALLGDFLKDHPENAAAHFQLAFAYGELKRTDESVAEYRRAIEIDPSFSEAHLNLGLTLLNRGDNSGAATQFLHAVELMPGQAKPRYLAGLALERAGKLPEAIQQYEQAGAADTKGYEIYFRWGLTLERVGRAADAEDRLRQAIALRPDFAPAHLALAGALLDEKKSDAAAAELAEYLKQNPNDTNARMQLASALNNSGKPAEALAELDRADAIAAPDVPRLKLRASISISQKDWDGAVRALSAAATQEPGDAGLHAELGRIYLEKRDFANAERELRRALSINPNEEGTLGNLITTVYLAGNYPAALDLLDIQEKRMAATPFMLFLRATCYDKLHRNAEAAAAYQQFLDADQGRDDKEEFQARERLKVLLRELNKK